MKEVKNKTNSNKTDVISSTVKICHEDMKTITSSDVWLSGTFS